MEISIFVICWQNSRSWLHELSHQLQKILALGPANKIQLCPKAIETDKNAR